MTWLENGVANVDWWDLHNGAMSGDNNSGSLYGSASYGDYGLLSNATGGEPAADTPFAPYYGLQMLTRLGKPGDQMVSASSSQSLLSVHAVKQAGGKLALLLINKNPSNSVAVSISVSGFTPAAASTVYTYGLSSSAISSASAAPEAASPRPCRVFADNGGSRSEQRGAPPPPPAPSAPVWSATATASPATLAPARRQ